MTPDGVRKTMADGNIAALREALEEMVLWMRRVMYSAWFIDADFRDTAECKSALDKADDALSAPPRNCDVGTTEEQYKRFKKFCFDNMGDGMDEPRCSKCPLGKTKASCKFDWAQMPYDKEESNG